MVQKSLPADLVGPPGAKRNIFPKKILPPGQFNAAAFAPPPAPRPEKVVDDPKMVNR
jgi:hypothetical protein